MNKDEIEELIKQAESGDTSSQYSIATIFYNGYEGFNVDFEKAAYWYRRAADLEDEEAQYQLAMMYFNGEGVTQDIEEGKKWLKKAAKNGQEEAKAWLS